QDASAQAIAALNERYGFDRPTYVQYGDWLARALTGDLGRSYVTQQTVASAIGPAIPVTIELALLSILIATTASVVLNSLTPAFRVRLPAVVVLTLSGITVPNFMIGISLIFVFSVALGWLPSTGWEPWSSGVLSHLQHIAMPVLTLSAYY